VTWRYSNDYCGWAPLPPFAVYREGVGFFYRGLNVSFGFDFGLGLNCFTFVPIGHFCDPHPRRFRATPTQVTQIYNHTTVINNFNGHGRNLANRGIDPEHITAVTRTPIHPISIRDTASSSGHGPRGDQLSHDGRTLVVNRPHFVDNPTPGGNRSHRPAQSGYPGQNHSPQQNNNWPASQTRQIRQPQEDNAISVPAQRPSPPVNYSTPSHDNRTLSPRGREQQPLETPRGNTRNSEAPGVSPTPNQWQYNAPEASHHNAPAAAPVERSQHNESSSAPESQKSDKPDRDQSGPGNGPRH
jgi:hypothetical protein